MMGMANAPLPVKPGGLIPGSSIAIEKAVKKRQAIIAATILIVPQNLRLRLRIIE
jgi:hypothetical protein